MWKTEKGEELGERERSDENCQICYSWYCEKDFHTQRANKLHQIQKACLSFKFIMLMKYVQQFVKLKLRVPIYQLKKY